WGTTKASGDGGVFEKETLEWMRFLEKNNISWANWSVNNKGEDSGILKYNKDRDAKGGWTEDILTPSGILVRKILRGEIK
ncbi:MAG: glycoside hydrolase family 5 protein, partial [Treponema sp.]|nr:glycoside hydrolase family 5 protein [Treponema sp.]